MIYLVIISLCSILIIKLILPRIKNKIKLNSYGEIIKKSNYLFVNKDYKEAIKELNKAIDIDGEYKDVLYILRGETYLKLKKYESTLKDFNKAIDINPSNSLAYNSRAFLYLNLERYESSLKDFNKTIMIDPSNNTAYNNRAFIYIRLKQYENALIDLNKSVEIDQHLSAAYKNYAHVFLKLSNIKKAEENILKAIKLNSSNGDNYIILAAINLYNEDYNSCYTNLKLAKDSEINYYDYFDDDIFDKIRHNDEFLSLFGSCPKLF